jgi:hypothetical protein
MTTPTPPATDLSDQNLILLKRLKPTLAFLKSYQQLGSFARTYMLKEQAEILRKLHAGVDQFENYSQLQKDYVEVLVYVELLERLCLIIEDLSKLLHALQLDLEFFLRSILTDKNPQNILKQIDAAKWQTILRYAPIGELAVSENNKLFLNDIRQRNIERLSTIIELCLNFLKLHWPFFIRHKHGNTILYGLQPTNIKGERSFMVPAVFDRNQPDKMKGFLVNETIYGKWQVFLDGLVQVIQWFVERTIVFIETGNKPFVEYQTCFPLPEEEKARIDGILKLCDADRKRTNVTVNIVATMEPDALQKFTDFYTKFDNSLIHK